MSTSERNKQLLREQRARSQREALPSALPEAGPYVPPNPLSGFMPQRLTVVGEPAGHDPAELMAQAMGFPSQAMGPTFLSYGPAIAEGDAVIEEWESFIFGSDGSLYNNQYCWILRFDGEQLRTVREYNDSHHAWLIFSRHGGWPALQPPTGPRRQHHAIGGAPAVLADEELETGFEVVDAFDLDPRLLADVHPTSGPPPLGDESGLDANKALVRALRRARASGDASLVNTFFAPGYRHFLAGEYPFGWDHLPLEQIYQPLVDHLASPISVRYGPPIADGDVVFEEMDIFARLDDGTVYNNWHAVVHEIRHGKIIQTREYLDTRHVWIVLARWADWGREPVPVRTRPRRSNLQSITCTTQTPTMFLDLERWHPFS
ncbi:MAG: hypothetical protein AB7V43_08565 [Acidimicrobiia bacterium]